MQCGGWFPFRTVLESNCTSASAILRSALAGGDSLFSEIGCLGRPRGCRRLLGKEGGWTAHKAKTIEPKTQIRSCSVSLILYCQVLSITRLVALTLPIPVAMSQPGVAPKVG